MDLRVNRLVTGIMAGAALSAIGVYLLDPVSGKRRRAMVRERIGVSAQRINMGSTWAQHAAGDAVARFKRDTTTDQYLLRRLRSAAARLVSRPAAIGVWASDGRVMLHGDVLPQEHEPFVRAVRALAGVNELTDHLREREAGDRIWRARSSHMPQPPQWFDFSSERWSPAARALAGTLGVASVAAAVREHRNPLAWLVGALGAGLIARSVANAPFKRLGGGRGIVDLRASTEINAPVEHVFRLLESYETRWDAIITAHRPNEMLAWRTVPESHSERWGVIRFEPLAENRTRVDVRMSYSPPGGMLGHAVASAFGIDARTELQHDLMRAKRFVETWKTAAEAAPPARTTAPVGARSYEPPSPGGADGGVRTTL